MKRDKDYIENRLYLKDNKVYAKEKVIIEIPKWYQNKGFLEMSDKVYIYGVFAIIMGDKYSVSLIPTLLSTIPINISETVKDDEEYLNLIYGPNDAIIDNINIVKHDLLGYNLFDTFFMHSKVPWFIEYKDLIKILDNLKQYANSNLGSNYIATEIMVSYITRNKRDKRVFYRHKLNEDYAYIDLMNVYYAATSTLNKLAGSYFDNALVSAIVQKEERPSTIENIVRQ